MLAWEMTAIGVDKWGWGIYPLHYLTRGDGLCNHPPPMFWKVNNILTYLYKYSVKINRFCSKNGWFLMIPAKFYQKFLQKYKILVRQAQSTVFFHSSPSLNLRLKVFTKLHDSSCKNTKFSSFWGGHIPPQTPPCAPLNHPNVKNESTPLSVCQ